MNCKIWRKTLYGLFTTMYSLSVIGSDSKVHEVTRTPSLGIESTVYVGDIIYQETVGEVVQCLVPLVEKREKKNFGLDVAIIRKGVPICEGDKPDEFIPPYKNWIKNNKDMGWSYPLKYKKRKSGDIKLSAMGMTFMKLTEEELRIEQLPRPDSEIKRLELLGVSENEARILYVESSVGETGDLRERNFSVNLLENSSIYWRGLEIEVLSAGRGKMTYKVINGFK